jgi:hypothetical protein
MRQSTRQVAGIAIAIAWCFVTHAVKAEAEAQPPSTPSLSTNIPDQKLDKAAAAIEQIASLKQDYLDQMTVVSPADRDRIAQEARHAFTTAITDQGLSVEEYAEVIGAAKNDPQIHEKVFQRIRRSHTRKD